MAKVLIGNFKGPQGDKGVKGDPGTAATIQVGTTQTVQPESNAEVTNSGTANAAVLSFKIPRGEDGMTDLTAEYKDASEYTCQPTVNAPVALKEILGKTEQGADPSPDNPQVIKGTGGTGYFDGVWRQGSYNISGVPDDSGAWISFANKIPCKANDSIKVSYDKDIVGIRIFYWNTSGGFLSIEPINGKETTGWTAPATAGSFVISFNDDNISPALAAYCTVTINGEYQTGVESVGKNLCSNDWRNGDFDGTNLNIRYSTDQKIFIKSGKKIICSINKNAGITYTLAIFDKNLNLLSNQIPFTKENFTYTALNDIYITPVLSNENWPTDNSAVVPVNNLNILDMQIELGETATEYHPYQSSALTIPLTSPLYEGDKICYVKPGESYVDAEGETVVADGMLYGCYRENAVVVFDGSGDEVFSEASASPGKIAFRMNDKAGSFYGEEEYLKCDKLKTIAINISVGDMPENSIKESGTVGDNVVFIYINEEVNTVQLFRTWLQSNPLTVLYKLAQPYFEPFVDQSIFYSLRTDDTLTYIYSSDPIEPVLTVEVAKNSTGGYLLESYAQAQKNAISEANSQSRISAIEQQLVNQATTPTE